MIRPGLMNERLMALFLLGLLLFGPPLMGAFDRPAIALGIPVLYLYLFLAWLCLIVLSALAIEGGAQTPSGSDPEDLERAIEDEG